LTTIIGRPRWTHGLHDELACYKPGERSRLIYRPKRHEDHKRGGRRSFAWTDYRDLLTTAHQQLGGPIVLIWDNCETDGAPA
jgi:hypothetical protein